MDALVDQVRSLAEKADEAGRSRIINALQALQQQLESPTDIFLKFYNSHIQLALIYVAVDLGLFKELDKDASATLTLTQLAETSKASPDLLESVLRYLSSNGCMANPSPGCFQATKLTHFLASPMVDAGMVHAFDTCGPPIMAFPSFLKEGAYQGFAVDGKTSFQKGHATELGAFQWLSQHPKNFGALQIVMTALQSADWLVGLDSLDRDARDVAVEEEASSSQKIFFVDVGGGHGHQCRQLLEKYPNLMGRLVLQDLPQAVDKLGAPINGVKVMAQDFFEKQSVEGAKFYYLRRIMHDWPDSECLKILERLTAAMGPDSRILIDEVVLPNTNAPWQATMQDVSMGILFGGKERTQQQWEALAAQAQLNLVQIHNYNFSSCNSIIVLGKAA